MRCIDLLVYHLLLLGALVPLEAFLQVGELEEAARGRMSRCVFATGMSTRRLVSIVAVAALRTGWVHHRSKGLHKLLHTAGDELRGIRQCSLLEHQYNVWLYFSLCQSLFLRLNKEWFVPCM